MGGERLNVSSAARTLNGAIVGCGAKSVVIGFGIDHPTDYHIKTQTYGVVPQEGFKCDGYDTPTHAGLDAARLWLDKEQAKRGLIIVVTDGSPTSPRATFAAFDKCKRQGYYVLNVQLGFGGKIVQPSTLKAMCHAWVFIDSATELVRVLQAPLQNFMAGVF